MLGLLGCRSLCSYWRVGDGLDDNDAFLRCFYVGYCSIISRPRLVVDRIVSWRDRAVDIIIVRRARCMITCMYPVTI